MSILRNTHVPLILDVPDSSREEGFRFVDMGNIFETDSKESVLVTTRELAVKYGNLVKMKIYTKNLD